MVEKSEYKPTNQALHYIITHHYDNQASAAWDSDLRKLYDSGQFKCVSGQLERGKKSGQIHLQAYVGAKVKIRGTAITKIIPGCHFKAPKKFQIDPANTGPRMHEYSIKEDTRVSPSFLVLGEPPVRVDQSANGKKGRDKQVELYNEAISLAKQGKFEEIDPILYVQHFTTFKRIHVESKTVPNIPFPFGLREWQSFVTKRISAPQEREIIWVYDSDGGSGKSTFAKWLARSPDTFYIDGGRKDELLFLIKETHNCLIIDLPRSGKDFVPYGLMETFKNGIWTSNKYEGNRVCRESIGVVIVFSNFLPDVSKLSKDRWNIIEVSKDKNNFIKVDWSDCIKID